MQTDQEFQNPFSNICRDAIRPFVPTEVPDELFHYTSTIGFKGIIENDTLWFSDCAYLNDGSEVRWGAGVLGRAAGELAGRVPESDQKLIERVVGRIEQITMLNRSAIFSLSARGNLLNQWRDYGKDVVAYSIGLDAKRLHMTPDYNFSPILMKVIYDPDDQLAVARNIVSGLYQVAGALDSNIRNDAKHVDFLVEAAAHEASLCVHMLKNPAFEAEEEWRLCLECATIFQIGIPLQFRAGGMGLTPYFEFHPKVAGEKLPVTSAMAGPSPDPDMAMHALRAFLEHHGYDGVRLSASTIPIR